MENGKVSYAGCIRHKEPLLCAHGALGRMFVHRFTIDKEPFPKVTVSSTHSICLCMEALTASM